MAIKPDKFAYSINEVLELVPIGRTALYADIAAGLLRKTKRGKTTLILADDLVAYLEWLRLTTPVSADGAAPTRSSSADSSGQDGAADPLHIPDFLRRGGRVLLAVPLAMLAAVVTPAASEITEPYARPCRAAPAVQTEPGAQAGHGVGLTVPNYFFPEKVIGRKPTPISHREHAP